MARRVKARWTDLLGSLGFVPAAIVVFFAALGFGLVELDETLRLGGVELVFQGDVDAARTVLSVIAGSLITVAGLTLSMTLVVLQLASTQFSPRILRTFFGDRLTQVTIGAYVGIFVYAVLVLRAVGSFGDSGGFVPRLSVTAASALGIGAVVLLIVFLHHVSQLIQVSHVTGSIADDTLEQIGRLYPEPHGEPEEDGADELLAAWRRAPSRRVGTDRPGFVQRVELDGLADGIGDRVERLAVLVRPGDFVSVETTLAEVWPADAPEECDGAVRAAVAIGRERNLDQDSDFGLRQLTDTAVKAMSPSINDPTTAVTCIGYIRSVLVRLAQRRFPARERRFAGGNLLVIVARREFASHLDALVEIARYARNDPRVMGELLAAAAAIADVARDSGAPDRASATRRVGERIAGMAGDA